MAEEKSESVKYYFRNLFALQRLFNLKMSLCAHYSGNLATPLLINYNCVLYVAAILLPQTAGKDYISGHTLDLLVPKFVRILSQCLYYSIIIHSLYCLQVFNGFAFVKVLLPQKRVEMLQLNSLKCIG